LSGTLGLTCVAVGMISDPQNLLDAQVVLKDGRAIWAAKEDPDLMWALRGGGGNFGGFVNTSQS
jgi:predicted alternative tryptophan synthase beta-subunit